MNLEKIEKNVFSSILRYSLPSIIAMILTSSITIVDGFFIGNYVGKTGLAAINLGLPILYIYLAFGIMLGVGGIAISGILFGQGNFKASREVFNQTMFTTLIVSCFLSFIMYFIIVFTGSRLEFELARYFKDYYLTMLFAYPLMIISSCFGMFIRGEGSPEYFMFVNIIILFSNLILDYIFVVSFSMKLLGVALASLISLLIGLGLMILFFKKKSKLYKFCRFNFSSKLLKSTLANGSSEMIGQLSMTISIALFNFTILNYEGVDGIAAFTIVGYLSFLFNMVIVGFGQGISPIVSYSYGAGRGNLGKELRRKTNLLVFLFGFVMLILILFLSDCYSGIFLSNEKVEEMIKSGLYIFSLSFLFTGINVISSFYFTSIGGVKESAIISAARGLFILIISILILPKIFGMKGIWMVAPVTEGITLLISGYFLSKEE